MRRRGWIIGAIGAITLSAAGAVFLVPAASSATTGASDWGRPPARLSAAADITHAQTIDVFTRQGKGRLIDADHNGKINFGDYDVFVEALRDAHGHSLGQDHVTCTIYDDTFMCRVTYTFTGQGDVTAEGAVRDGKLAVTGGTDHYANVRGEVRFVRFTRHGVHFRFELLP